MLEELIFSLAGSLYSLANYMLMLARRLIFLRGRIPTDIKKILVYRVGNIGDIRRSGGEAFYGSYSNCGIEIIDQVVFAPLVDVSVKQSRGRFNNVSE